MATLATNRSHGGSSCDVVVGGLESDLLAGCCVHSIAATSLPPDAFRMTVASLWRSCVHSSNRTCCLIIDFRPDKRPPAQGLAWPGVRLRLVDETRPNGLRCAGTGTGDRRARLFQFMTVFFRILE